MERKAFTVFKFIYYYLLSQVVHSCSGQLWDLQRGPAPAPDLQGRAPLVLPDVAGEDLCVERH